MSLLGQLFETRARRVRPTGPKPAAPKMPEHPRGPARQAASPDLAPDPIALAQAHARQPRGLAQVGRAVVSAALAGRKLDPAASTAGAATEPTAAARTLAAVEGMEAPAMSLAAASEPSSEPVADLQAVDGGFTAKALEGGGGGGYSSDPVLAAMAAEYYSEADLLGLPAVEAAIALISGTLASMPIMVMEPDADGILQTRPAHPVSRLLAAPSRYMNAHEFMERIVADVATGGDGVASITRDGRGVPAELRYLPPGWVFPERSPRSQLVFYRVSDQDTGTSYILPDEDVLHIRWRLDPRDRLHGLSVVRLGARTLRLAAASENFASAMFRNRGVPGAVVTTEKPLNDKAKKNLRSQIAAFFSGTNAGRAMVLEGTQKFELSGHNLRDSQLVETTESLVAATGRLFGVPSALLNQAGEQSFAGIKEIISAWLRLGLRSWITRVEQALTDKLLSEDAKARGAVVRFQTEALTRLDDADRARFYSVMVGAGVMTGNEARRREGLGPRPGGDELRRMPGEPEAGGRPPGARDTSTGDPTPGPNPEG